MPSFDIVSEIDAHELQNAIDQTNRELDNRFDFKGTDSKVEHQEQTLLLRSASEFQIKQINDILDSKLAKRSIDVRHLKRDKIETASNSATQNITVQQGIDKELAKRITKLVKEQKMKVQASIQGGQVRVTGKKRDDLQTIISAVKEAGFDLPLQFVNFRD